MLGQDSLDLAEFDAVATEFDLGVDAAVELELTVVGDPPVVAGAVDAVRGIVGQVAGSPG